MPCDCHFNVGGNDAAAQGFQTREHSFCDSNGVCAFAFGDRDGYGGKESSAIREAYVLRRLFTAVDNAGDVANENGLIACDTCHDIPDIVGAGKKASGLQQILLVATGELTGS